MQHRAPPAENRGGMGQPPLYWCKGAPNPIRKLTGNSKIFADHTQFSGRRLRNPVIKKVGICGVVYWVGQFVA
jgi:hypothetical protein